MPQTRVAASAALIILLLAMFPANIKAARERLTVARQAGDGVVATYADAGFIRRDVVVDGTEVDNGMNRRRLRSEVGSGKKKFTILVADH